jgi:AraC family transcriptional regulator of adaptative response/methylated-DNA-[protein]-cysteine methyltransferase
VEEDPARRWHDHDLRTLGMSPERVRRWFLHHHGMTFHAYSRARRLGQALDRIQGGDRVSRAAFDAGFDSLSGFNDAFRRLAGASPVAVRDAPLLRSARVPTPLGPMIAVADDDALLLLEFADRRAAPTQLRRLQELTRGVLAPGASPVFARVEAELAEYFRGERRAFEVATRSPGTPFQREVWSALLEIPFGETRSYAQVARQVGRPRAVRAVARANGANRLAILIPCHRVVGSDGALTGYGGSLWRKQRLLELEAPGA